MLVIACVAVCALTAAAVAAGPWARRSFERLRGPPLAPRDHLLDPGRGFRAERRAEQPLRSVLGEAFEAWLRARLRRAARWIPVYGYLIYPHKPIVSFDAASGELLNEHCVAFPDRSELENALRPPDADDVLAKWDGAARGDEA